MTLLLEVLPKATFKSSVLVLLAEMAGADHVRGWLAPFDDTPPVSIVNAMASGKESLLAELHSKDANARAAAPVALAMLPSLASESVPAFDHSATPPGGLEAGRIYRDRIQVVKKDLGLSQVVDTLT